MATFSDRLKGLRIKFGESQDDIARVIGKSREAYCKYEGGRSNPNLVVLRKIVKHYDVSADYIIGSTDNDYSLILTNPALEKFEPYLIDSCFLPYLGLAVKVKENDIELADVENFVDNLIKYSKKR